jgi:GTPase SAR1 family protein
MRGKGHLLQLIDERGQFDENACESFLHDAGAIEWNKKYNVISIMGPQSSGKSTLMNHAFGTSFQEMDELSGCVCNLFVERAREDDNARFSLSLSLVSSLFLDADFYTSSFVSILFDRNRRRQTTKGVWMAIAESEQSSSSNNNNTVVLDLEGSDGRERGEDDQTFEKQTALFALASSDVLLVNVWCNDIGREHASGKPLLKTILQVNLKLFCNSSSSATRKTKLVFVIRDRSKTPIELLEKSLKEDVEQVWQSIKKPEHFANSDVSEFFDVGYFSLPHYLHENELFVKECQGLRAALMSSTDSSSVVSSDGDTTESKVPSTALPTSMREIWKAVQENRDLDLPAHAIMVATVRCEEIATMCADAVEASDAIGMLCERANTPNASECTTLGKEIEAIAKTGFDVYDAETAFFDKNVRDMKRRELAGKLTTVFKPTLEAHFTNVSKKLLTKVRRELDAAASGFENDEDASKKKSLKFSQMALSLEEESINAWNEHVANSTPTENIDGWNFEIVKDLTRLFHKDLEETIDHEKTEKSALMARNVERTFSRQISTSILGAVDEFSREICVDDEDEDGSSGRKSEDAEAASKRRQREEKKYSLWPAARLAYRASEKKWMETLENALLNFDLPGDAFESRKNEAENAIKIASKGTCFEAGDKASEFMRQSFNAYFNKTKEGIPRVWTSSDDVGKIARMARLNAVNVLANVCINRIGADMPRLKAVAMTQFQTEEAKTFAKEERMKIAKVEKALRTLVPGTNSNNTSSSSETDEDQSTSTRRAEEEEIAQPPFPSEWSLKVCDTKASDVVLSPSECRQHYRRFEAETTHFVAQALHAQQNAQKDGLFGGAPMWMIFALFVLGWNEIVYFLTHPFRLMFFIFLALYARAILRQINAQEAFKLGVVPGCAFLVAKGVPAAVAIFQKLIEQQSPQALTEGLDFSKVLLGATPGGASSEDDEEREEKRNEKTTDGTHHHEPMDIDSPHHQAKKNVSSPFASVRRRTAAVGAARD